MAAANSTKFKLLIGTTPVAIACQTDTSFSVQRDMVETSCKDFNGFRTYRPGAKGASANVEGIVQTPAGTTDPATLLNSLLNGDLLTVEVSSDEAGVPGLSGSAYVENYEQTGSGIEGMVTFSGTLRFSGSFSAS